MAFDGAPEPTLGGGALSVADICALPLLSGVEVLAGGTGLDRAVVRLNVMTLPDIARWTKPEELLLTSGYPLPRDAHDLTQLVEELEASGVSALAVKLDSYVPALSATALTTADRLGFPVLSIPESVAFDDILSTVLSLIANRQAVTLAHAQDVGDALLQVSVQGGLDDIITSLSNGLGNTGVLCTDPRGEVLAEQLTESDRDELRGHGLLRKDGRLSRLSALAHTRANSCLVVRPLPAGESAQGHLLAIRRSDPFDPHEELMVEQAAMVAALSISKTLAVQSVTRRFATNTLHTLLTGPSEQVDDLANSATAFGWDLCRPTRVLVGQVPELADPSLRERLQVEWESMIRVSDRSAAVGSLGGDLIAVCGVDMDVERVALDAIRRISTRCAVQVSVGISEQVTGAADLHRAWPHAETAADLAARIDDGSRVRRYETLGLLRLLDAVSDRAEIEEFLRLTLGPVLDLPKRQRDEMLETLGELVHNKFNAAQTARNMHYHYNTVRYRVRNLEKLLGDFTGDSHLSLCIGVALEALPLTTVRPATSSPVR